MALASIVLLKQCVMASSRTRLWLLFVWCVGSAKCQTQGSRYYNRDYQDHDSYGNTYVYNDRRYGRPNYPGEDDYNRGYGENDGRYHYQVSDELGAQTQPSLCMKPELFRKERFWVRLD